MKPQKTRTLVLYGRYGCHLCDDMRAALEVQRASLGFDFTEIDITGDPGLEADYGTRVPVLTGGDTEICCYFLDLEALRRYFSEPQG